MLTGEILRKKDYEASMPKKTVQPQSQPRASRRLRRVVQKRRFLRGFRTTGQVGPGIHKAGVGREVVRRWLATDPSFAENYGYAQEAFRDSLHGLLMQKVQAGDKPALRLMLQLQMPEKYGPASVRRALAKAAGKAAALGVRGLPSVP